MVVARFFGCSPYEVVYVWPVAMRERAEAFVEVYSKPRIE